jgi:hypothetical protein
MISKAEEVAIGCGTLRKSSVSSFSVPAKFRTENILNTSLEHYRYNSLFHNNVIYEVIPG